MDAIDYEYLMRSVYHCGRNATKGADADIYRKIEHAAYELTDSNWKGTPAEKEYKYNSAFAEVRMYLRKALREGLNQIQYKASKAEIEKIEGMEREVLNIGFYDKSRLDQIIDEAGDIFRKHGLKA